MAEEVKEQQDQEHLSIDELTGVQKAAILLILLGPEVAPKVFRELSEDVIRDITKEIAMVKTVDPEIAKEVLKEFFALSVAKEQLVKGGVEYAKKILVDALGPEKAKRVVASLVKNMETSIGFEALKNIRPQQLAKIIQKEHPQTIALILAHLDPPRAAECLAELPEKLKVEVVKRLASLSDISPEVLRRLSVVLEEKLQSVGTTNVEIGGPKTVAEILNRMDRESTKEILDDLAKDNPELATQVRDLMFVFEDIVKLDDVAIREILKRVDKNVLTVALKGASDEVKDKFFRNMSKRAAETLQEEMEYLGPVKLKDVEAAQREIVELIRKLEDEGVISIGGAGEEIIS